MLDDNFGNAFQRQFNRSVGVPGEPKGGPVLEAKKVGPNMPGGVNDPRSKQYDPNAGFNVQGFGGGNYQPEGGPFGGAGGPMPIPEGGPWLKGGGPPGTGGFDPVGPGGGLGGPYDEGGGPQNPMPMPAVNWNTVNGNTFANVNPNFGDPYAASQMVKQENMMNPAWRDTGNGNGYVDLHRRPGGRVQPQAAPPMPGNTGIVPPHLRGGRQDNRPMNAPPMSQQAPPMFPQATQTTGGFNWGQALPQQARGWDWSNLGNILNRRY